VERSVLRVRNFFVDLNEQLAKADYVAGRCYSAADVTAMVTIDFAAAALDLSAPPEHTALANWYKVVAGRPSSAA
jgi:glutathione S-transferase